MYRYSRAFAVRQKYGWWGYYKQRLYEDPLSTINATIFAILAPTLLYIHLTSEKHIQFFKFEKNAREYMKYTQYQKKKVIPEEKMVYELI